MPENTDSLPAQRHAAHGDQFHSEVLNGKRKVLLAQGCLFLFGRRHLRQVNEMFGGSETPENLVNNQQMRAHKMERHIHSTILSDEDVCTRLDLSLLREPHADFNVKEVYYLRRQDLWLESWYLKNIKWQWDQDFCHVTFDELLVRRYQFFWLDLKEFVVDLENEFGRENLLLSVWQGHKCPENLSERLWMPLRCLLKEIVHNLRGPTMASKTISKTSMN